MQYSENCNKSDLGVVYTSGKQDWPLLRGLLLDFSYSIIAFNIRVVQIFALHYVKFKSTAVIILHFLLNTLYL